MSACQVLVELLAIYTYAPAQFCNCATLLAKHFQIFLKVIFTVHGF
ncbi:hypothetical protein PSYMO_40617 [Pseudomonas amygdali pv. mori str. 301020]|uniref:Uncharacterized protein n=1 Tax=Pseudomonas amygdali pv. mori str. 301020 TaxID=629261 RepID=A0A656GPS5_PSEA0|nr:hypothetical protein PSYMO_40617 [Pseudomonas amygdali pv. mori str. 301020]